MHTVTAHTNRAPAETTGLRGNFRLERISVDVHVNHREAGVFTLGSLAPPSPARPWSPTTGPDPAGSVPGELSIKYVGRSDHDLRSEIAEHIGRYDAFQFEFYPNDVAAFEKECRLYHSFGGPDGKLDNPSHPPRPERFPRMSCPVCGAG